MFYISAILGALGVSLLLWNTQGLAYQHLVVANVNAFFLGECASFLATYGPCTTSGSFPLPWVWDTPFVNNGCCCTMQDLLFWYH